MHTVIRNAEKRRIKIKRRKLNKNVDIERIRE